VLSCPSCLLKSRRQPLVLRAISLNATGWESSGSVTRYKLLKTNGAPAKPFGLSRETLHQSRRSGASAWRCVFPLGPRRQPQKLGSPIRLRGSRHSVQAPRCPASYPVPRPWLEKSRSQSSTIRARRCDDSCGHTPSAVPILVTPVADTAKVLIHGRGGLRRTSPSCRPTWLLILVPRANKGRGLRLAPFSFDCGPGVTASISLNSFGNLAAYCSFLGGTFSEESVMGRAILLWLLGVPIPIIILLALLWH
jgi:hypothetical protein